MAFRGKKLKNESAAQTAEEKELEETVPEEAEDEEPEDSGYNEAEEERVDYGKYASRDRIIDEWQSDARKLAIVIPDFDFQSALRNNAFRTALTSGMNVFEAYTQMVKIPQGKPRQGITQNAQSARRTSGEAARNVAALPSKQFKAYIDKIKNG